MHAHDSPLQLVGKETVVVSLPFNPTIVQLPFSKDAFPDGYKRHFHHSILVGEKNMENELDPGLYRAI